MPVPRNDQDPLARFQPSQGVQKLFLDTLLAIEEVDVIHHQHVHIAEALPEAGDGSRIEGLGEVVGKRLGRQRQHLFAGIVSTDLLRDRFEQMGFAVAHSTIEIERMANAAQDLLDTTPGQHVAGALHKCRQLATAPRICGSRCFPWSLHLTRHPRDRARCCGLGGCRRWRESELIVMRPQHSHVPAPQLADNTSNERAVLLLQPASQIGAGTDERQFVLYQADAGLLSKPVLILMGTEFGFQSFKKLLELDKITTMILGLHLATLVAHPPGDRDPNSLD